MLPLVSPTGDREEFRVLKDDLRCYMDSNDTVLFEGDCVSFVVEEKQLRNGPVFSVAANLQSLSW